MAQQMIEELKRKLAAAEKAQASQKAAESSKAEKPESSKPAKAKSSNKGGTGESRTVAALLDQTQVAVDVSLHSKPASAPAIRAPSPDRPKLQSKIVVPRKNLPSPPILYKEDAVVLEAGESNPPSPKRSRKNSEDHRPSHRTTLPSTSKAPQHSASEEPYLLSAGRMKRLMSMIANLREELDDLECQLTRCRQLQ
ncbi:hypothetical protein DdX_20275 [Ditylenchus destructor]|uniref:Uncharacterized protein n=1 Tax=Ditylenchus destructor TaxID=166010 RepID=A0AAD4MHG8_9BILA|nr:hypothetical protein DdX_20275 [Ditylenchus destructor]